MTENAYYVIRNGETINIGKPGRGTLVKYNNNDYFLKINAWCTDNFAYTTDDIIVIDGFWKQNTDDSTIIKIEKTYLYYDGSAWTFAKKLPSVVNGGMMQAHPSGMSGKGIYFSMAANDAPYKSDWSLEYTQTSVDNIKLIRNGETISIGIVGKPMFVKTSDTQYYLKLEGWTIGEYGLDKSSSITTSDVIVIEGDFKYAAENVTLNISKSYIYHDGSQWVFTDKQPNIYNVVEVGKHSSRNNTNGIFFLAAANDAYIRMEKTTFTFNADGTVTVLGATARYVEGDAMSGYGTMNWFGEGMLTILLSGMNTMCIWNRESTNLPIACIRLAATAKMSERQLS